MALSRLSLCNYLREENHYSSVNLFSTSNNFTRDASAPNSQQPLKVKPRLSLIIDSESCLSRLYGGYYSDWASGGQWNRMNNYIANLSKACQANDVHITVSIRGGVEKEHAEALFRMNREFKERLNRMMLHLQNRGTPPPKVWWLPPTCLREVIGMAMQYHGVSVLSTNGDYYTDVMAHLHSHNIDGILTDDPGFTLLNPPRLFAAHDFKLTYKGSLETKEYFVDKLTTEGGLTVDRLPLLASLLGNHIISPEDLKEFHKETSGGDTESFKSMEEEEIATISKLIKFVKEFADPKNIETIGNVVFRNSSITVEEGIAKLTRSIEYYENFYTSHQAVSPEVVRSELDILPVKSDGKQRKKNAVVDDNFESDDAGDTDGDKAQEAKEGNEADGIAMKDKDENSAQEDSSQQLADEASKLTLNGNIQETEVEKLHVNLSSSEAILKLAVDRHSRGLMSPIILQSLIQREVRLPCYIENIQSEEDRKSTIEIYRPIRQSVYAILHNLNKHLYDTRKVAEGLGNTVSADDISITVVEHYLGPHGAEVDFDIRVTPVPWPVPSVESLWLGVKPENKLRRMKAFLSCMQVGSNPVISNPMNVPERFLLICCVLRYLLKCEPAELTVCEVDAVLAMATSTILFDVQTMQDMQLPLISPRGAHVASLVMAGVQHAILVNDTCGAPIHKSNTFPWLYFDGKLLQYKLLKAANAQHIQRLDLCDGQMAQVIAMEKLRQAVWHGLENKFGPHIAPMPFNLATALPAGRMFAAPTAFLRPSIPSTGRGKGSLMGEFLPVNSRLDGRGGKLQVAGQVVATWGPRPGSHRERNNGRIGDYNPSMNDYHGAPVAALQHRPHGRKKAGYHQNRHNQPENKTKNQNANAEVPETKSEPPSSAVTIATKEEKAEANITSDEGVNDSKAIEDEITDEPLVNGGNDFVNNSNDSGLATDTTATSTISQ